MTSIIIVDTEKDFRKNVKNALSVTKEYKIVGLGKDGYDAIRLAEKHKPDIALLALELPILDAFQVSASIKQHSPKTGIVIISQTSSYETIIEIINQGISGCVLLEAGRNNAFEEIKAALREVIEKGYYFSAKINDNAIKILADYIRRKGADNKDNALPLRDTAQLSKIETQIVALVGNGLSNKEIAAELRLKEGTIRNYISAILNKTGLDHRTQIAIYSFALGFSGVEFILKRIEQRKKNPLARPEQEKSRRRRPNNPPLDPLQGELF